jgi:hypothetical protein
MVHHEVKPGQSQGPTSLPAVEFLGGHEVLQVLMVRPDLKLVRSAF